MKMYHENHYKLHLYPDKILKIITRYYIRIIYSYTSE
jgi:hypothetical protein